MHYTHKYLGTKVLMPDIDLQEIQEKGVCVGRETKSDKSNGVKYKQSVNLNKERSF